MGLDYGVVQENRIQCAHIDIKVPLPFDLIASNTVIVVIQ